MDLIVKGLYERWNSNNTVIFSLYILLFKVNIVSIILGHPYEVGYNYPSITVGGNAAERERLA